MYLNFQEKFHRKSIRKMIGKYSEKNNSAKQIVKHSFSPKSTIPACKKLKKTANNQKLLTILPPLPFIFVMYNMHPFNQLKSYLKVTKKNKNKMYVTHHSKGNQQFPHANIPSDHIDYMAISGFLMQI